jgi:DNA-binding LacI/PurR family transcriptional regulator
VCRSREFAAAAERAAQAVGLSVPKDLTIIHEASSATAAEKSSYPRVVRHGSFKDTAFKIGQMLLKQFEGAEEKSRHEVVPFEMREA